MKRHIALLLVLLGCLLPLSAFTTAPMTNNHTVQGKNCVTWLAPVRKGQQTSEIVSQQCYSTYSQAIFAATAGKVQLPANSTPRDLKPSMLNYPLTPNTSHIFGEEFTDSNFNGYTDIFSTSGPPCSSSTTYGFTYVGDTFNDTFSSLLGALYGCNWTVLWANSNYQGTSQWYNGSTAYVGSVMNDRTSSLYWRP